MILLRRGQDAAESETWIRLENGAVLEQSRNPRFKAARQTVCEKGALPFTASCRTPCPIKYLYCPATGSLYMLVKSASGT